MNSSVILWLCLMAIWLLCLGGGLLGVWIERRCHRKESAERREYIERLGRVAARNIRRG
jgi:hypothetical protein